jgi:hypothetical protein
MRSSEEGLNPVEVISVDLDVEAVANLLTGPEDCAVFFDLDNLRRFTGLWSRHVWDISLSMMIRATESRRRLVLASSSPEIGTLFSEYGDAFVVLPAPSGSRDWRLEDGRKTLRKLEAMEPEDASEYLLLAAFDPVIPEDVFRRTLFSLWERLFARLYRRFPTVSELEARYAGTDAAKGNPPFRRVRIAGEMHLTSGDAILLSALDEAIEASIRRSDIVIRTMREVLLDSPDPRVRKAGYTLLHFYPLLSDDDKAGLLYAVSRETDLGNLLDAFTILLRNPDVSDEGVAGLCEYVAGSPDRNARLALAEVCAKPWIRESDGMRPVVDRLASDPSPDVRASLMRGLVMWGDAGDPGGFYARLLSDPSAAVRAQVLMYLGSRFPALTRDEMEVINEVLAGSDGRLLRNLSWGLLSRGTEEFQTEFTDLLWVLLERMPPGGKGFVARQIGGRLRYFDMDVRRALVSNLEEQDTTAVVMCLLMNHSWLTPEEYGKLWTLATERIAQDIRFASLVLRYFSAFEPGRRDELVRLVLTSESFEGREALSQLLARMRWDLTESALGVARNLALHGTIEEKARLPWFLLLNHEVFGEEGSALVSRLASDDAPVVRAAVARAILKQGLSGSVASWLLVHLAEDPERSVRASAGEALGKLGPDLDDDAAEALELLLSDPDPSVRARTLTGAAVSVREAPGRILERLSVGAGDASPAVRREAVASLSLRRELLDLPGAPGIISILLSDADEKVRLEAARLATASPSMIMSEVIRRKLPDLLLDRSATGGTIGEELGIAREIQKEFLPVAPPRLENYDIEFFYDPAKEIGGDYFDFFVLPEDNIGVVVGDVSGKGIPAALTMASIKGNLAAQVQNIFSISEIMKRVNESVSLGGEGSSLVGLFYGVLNVKSGLLTYINAGHNPPVLLKREGQTKLLTEGGLLLGVDPEASYEYGIVRVETADVLLMYTDGITEAMSPSGQEFGLMRLIETCLSTRDLPAVQMISRVLDAVGRHCAGTPRADDQTLVVIRHR